MIKKSTITLRANIPCKYVVLINVLLLAACGGESAIKPTPTRPILAPAPTKSTAQTPAPTQKNGDNASAKTEPKSEIKPEAKPGAGGYYLDDGPGENAPTNIDSIPGAPLKAEQPNKRANRPYIALGQQYTPMTNYVPYKKQGIASWYGKRFHGKKTSTGEIYDMYAMSAAHTVLPIPSYAKVTNPANGRSVVVRINDRGPFKHDRLIDLSYAAAYQLRLIKQGSGLVEVETIDTSAESIKQATLNKPVQTAAIAEISTANNTADSAQVKPMEAVVTASPMTQTVATESIVTNPTATKPTEVAASSTTSASAANATSAATVVSATTQYYVQAGAFKIEANGDLLQKRIQGLDFAENVGIASVYNKGLYRVRLGPYANKKEADTSAAKIRGQLNIAAIVTN